MGKLTATITKLLSNLDSRKRDVLVSRFGLDGKPAMTLQAVGDKYNVTRERIRQIEALGLAEARAALPESREAGEVIKIIASYLDERGGVARESILASEMAKTWGEKSPIGALAFVREASRSFNWQGETPEFHSFWYTDKATFVAAKNFISSFAKAIAGKRQEAVNSAGVYDKIFTETATGVGVNSKAGANYLTVSKKFAVSPYGDKGLSDWPEVNPVTIRDWSYLVLKKAGEPLHFETIAKKIAEVHTKRNKVFTPTVHNELIKDSRFVLVGRGVYSLTECGYEQGGVKDLIRGMLKKSGPMTATEIVEVVSKQRLFKKNTILLHLQNRKLFSKGNDGKYFSTAV